VVEVLEDQVQILVILPMDQILVLDVLHLQEVVKVQCQIQLILLLYKVEIQEDLVVVELMDQILVQEVVTLLL
tara:strand:+ start:255 stop:473 length:219 start_codon:yes stop_codon:yes gene_type:complete